jgi:hypothetical protein
MNDADLSDWAWIARYDDIARGAYIYDHAAKSVDHLVNLDWPITWALSRFNKQKQSLYTKAA